MAGGTQRAGFPRHRHVSAGLFGHPARSQYVCGVGQRQSEPVPRRFAIGQLFWGPLSDRYGRKPILLTGLAIFAISCLGMLWVRDATLMLVLRFIQAIGVCAAAVTWQAMVTDYYPAQRTNRIFATIMPLVGLSPALAPLLGSWLLAHLEWQAIFATLFAIALLLMVPALRLKPVVRPQGDVREKLTFMTLLRSREYSGNVLIYAACSASFFLPG